MSKMTRTVNLGVVQMRCEEAPERNLEKALALTRDAVSRGAQLICLPELFRSRYFCQTEDSALFDLAEPVPGPSTDAFTALATELT